jgi:uncharacterized LabA/DUF88 family protein
MSNSKVGVYVDSENIRLNDGMGMRYDILREFACRDGAEAVRLNAYTSYDEKRAKNDSAYYKKTNGFYNAIREMGYKVNKKVVKWYTDDDGNSYKKANADLDMAVDALLQSENLDRVLLATGDGDFVKVVRALQNKGCRVEIVALDNVSVDLRHEADMYMPGYLIPDLFGLRQPLEKQWGEIGSFVIGCCYHYDNDHKYGFMRYMKSIAPGIWFTDSRNPNSPYKTAHFNKSSLPSEVLAFGLPSRKIFFRFKLAENNGKGFQATEIQVLKNFNKT